MRTQLRVLEAKGHVRHEEEGTKYVYFPVVPRRVVRKSALKHVMNTFFDGSAEKVVAALLGPDGGRLERRGARSHCGSGRRRPERRNRNEPRPRRRHSFIDRPGRRPRCGLAAEKAARGAAPLGARSGAGARGHATGDQPDHSRAADAVDHLGIRSDQRRSQSSRRASPSSWRGAGSASRQSSRRRTGLESPSWRGRPARRSASRFCCLARSGCRGSVRDATAGRRSLASSGGIGADAVGNAAAGSRARHQRIPRCSSRGARSRR